MKLWNNLKLCLVSLSFTSSLLFSAPVYEKVGLGMSLKDFNNLRLGETISHQKNQAISTKYGLVKLDSLEQDKFYGLRDKEWTGLRVTVQNNKVLGYHIQSKNQLSLNMIPNTFSSLAEIYGHHFTVSGFQSLGRHGQSIHWKNKDYSVSMNIIVDERKNKCRILLKHSMKEQESDNLENINPKPYITALEPYLGPNFHLLSTRKEVVNIQ